MDRKLTQKPRHCERALLRGLIKVPCVIPAKAGTQTFSCHAEQVFRIFFSRS
ncbi:hypothetical protein [Rickettsia endosymbiont of Orchestes rusci]|uniref:hypothetical protein n=1 Tax=Rickettsia endosymbiont of Orchestes rusci TaxID=3066250 RepID=UPI00313C3F9E